MTLSKCSGFYIQTEPPGIKFTYSKIYMQVKKGNFGYWSLSLWKLPEADIAAWFNFAFKPNYLESYTYSIKEMALSHLETFLWIL